MQMNSTCGLSPYLEPTRRVVLNPRSCLSCLCIISPSCWVDVNIKSREHVSILVVLKESSLLAGIQQCFLRPGCFPAAAAHPGDLPHPAEGKIPRAVRSWRQVTTTSRLRGLRRADWGWDVCASSTSVVCSLFPHQQLLLSIWLLARQPLSKDTQMYD